MKVSIYKDGVAVGERDIPTDMAGKANEVRAWMASNGVESFCGLTCSMNSHLKVEALRMDVERLKATLKLADALRNRERRM